MPGAICGGKMSRDELETRTGKNIFQTGAAVWGASVGASIGALGGPVGMLIGSLVGGMITSLAMNIALDNHIEKPSGSPWRPPNRWRRTAWTRMAPCNTCKRRRRISRSFIKG
jgi:phage tail tape-measure protein